ncbi:glycyl-radical enzyme activating protein [Actinomyces glycerinitolerans]|uniref:Radical sam n=1 Tax=Actinomyces glycerinitolerans TaxID=1892869 RepID=A0A1M4RV20_9ACTO|nr:glycyl-radical enzyme activating protein [Actinomyces glycerinitolerans]SHE23834.1 radical sam [Actinomyces glycerinitolerans]
MTSHPLASPFASPNEASHRADNTAVVFNIQRFSLHDGPGIRTVVFLKGCPLACPWCANPESINPGIEQLLDPTTGEATPAGRRHTLAEVLKECEADRPFFEESGGGVTLSGGEPMMQHVFATELLQELQQRGIHTAMESTGHVAPRVFDRALDHLDYLLIDVKHHDRDAHKRWTGGYNDLPLRNLSRALERGIRTQVRIPVIPGVNDALDDATAFADLLRSLGAERVQLLPFHQFGERKYTLLGRPYRMAGVPALHPEDLVDYRAAMVHAGIEAFF